jgi:PKD repeat protein
MSRGTSERRWAIALIVLGATLLGVAFVFALRVALDPGGYYERWVPVAEADGPQAGYTWTSNGRRVTFTDTSAAGASELQQWEWNFGDGSTSTETSPSHRYPDDGEYTVTLRVTDVGGLDSRAQAGVTVQANTENTGQGELGLTDLADSVTATVERSTKGVVVVILVVGLFVVMVLAGGRVLKQGVQALRPIPGHISVKVRPKELERELEIDFARTDDGGPHTAEAAVTSTGGASERVPSQDEHVTRA